MAQPWPRDGWHETCGREDTGASDDDGIQEGICGIQDGICGIQDGICGIQDGICDAMLRAGHQIWLFKDLIYCLLEIASFFRVTWICLEAQDQA